MRFYPRVRNRLELAPLFGFDISQGTGGIFRGTDSKDFIISCGDHSLSTLSPGAIFTIVLTCFLGVCVLLGGLIDYFFYHDCGNNEDKLRGSGRTRGSYRDEYNANVLDAAGVRDSNHAADLESAVGTVVGGIDNDNSMRHRDVIARWKLGAGTDGEKKNGTSRNSGGGGDGDGEGDGDGIGGSSGGGSRKQGSAPTATWTSHCLSLLCSFLLCFSPQRSIADLMKPHPATGTAAPFACFNGLRFFAMFGVISK